MYVCVYVCMRVYMRVYVYVYVYVWMITSVLGIFLKFILFINYFILYYLIQCQNVGQDINKLFIGKLTNSRDCLDPNLSAISTEFRFSFDNHCQEAVQFVCDRHHTLKEPYLDRLVGMYQDEVLAYSDRFEPYTQQHQVGPGMILLGLHLDP